MLLSPLILLALLPMLDMPLASPAQAPLLEARERQAIAALIAGISTLVFDSTSPSR